METIILPDGRKAEVVQKWTKRPWRQMYGVKIEGVEYTDDHQFDIIHNPLTSTKHA